MTKNEKKEYWVEIGDDESNHIPTLHYGKKTWSDPVRAMEHLIAERQQARKEVVEEIKHYLNRGKKRFYFQRFDKPSLLKFLDTLK
jgi:hypothetical protein